MAKALEIARDLAAKPPMAMLLTKRRMRELTQPGYDATIEAAKDYQRQAYGSGEPQRVAEAFIAGRRARRGGS
jgi:enoyl-CoA hydratase/carnithine racemase